MFEGGGSLRTIASVPNAFVRFLGGRAYRRARCRCPLYERLDLPESRMVILCMLVAALRSVVSYGGASIIDGKEIPRIIG